MLPLKALTAKSYIHILRFYQFPGKSQAWVNYLKYKTLLPNLFKQY